MKLTIRDLLWLMVVVALGLGWWFDRGRLWGAAYSLNLSLEHAERELADWKAAHKASLSRPAALDKGQSSDKVE